MNKTKLIAFILSLILLVPCLSVLTYAADDCDVWDGTIAESFSDNSSGYYGDPIEIKTAEEFALFADQVRTSTEEAYKKCFKLMTDIDLADKPFAPIGGQGSDGIFNFEFYYIGDFNGNGHTIKGLNLDTSVTNDKNAYVGLFGILKEGAVIRNLNVEGEFEANTKQEFGVIAGKAINSSIINCSVNVNATVSAYESTNTTIYIGGIVGIALDASVVKDCVVKGTIKGVGRHAPAADAPEGTLNKVAVVLGGIAGRANSNNATSNDTIKISNCMSSATLKVGTADNIYVGGIFGVNNTLSSAAINDSVITVAISDCLSTGNIILDGTWTANAYIGGLVGNALSTLTVKDSLYSGTLPSSSSNGTIKAIAGIVGASSKEASVFENCTCSYITPLPSGVTGINCTGAVMNSDSAYSDKADEIMMLIQENYDADKAKTADDEANFVMPENKKENTANTDDSGSKDDGSNNNNAAQNNSQNSTDTTSADEGGCGSTVGTFGVLAIILVCTLGVVVTARKAKED